MPKSGLPFVIVAGVLLFSSTGYAAMGMDYGSCTLGFKPLNRFNANARDFCACVSGAMGDLAFVPFISDKTKRAAKLDELTPCLRTYIKPVAYEKCIYHNEKQTRTVGGQRMYVDCDCNYRMTEYNWHEMWDGVMRGEPLSKVDKKTLDIMAYRRCIR